MKTAKLITIFVMASLILAACGQTPAQPTDVPLTESPDTSPVATDLPTDVPAEPDPVTRTKVQVISWWDFTASAPLQELKAGFEAANPDLELEFIQVGTGYADKVLTMIAGGGDLPDVMMLAMDKIPLFADRGAILNLDSYITDDFKASLHPIVLDALSYNGSVYAAARDVSTKVMYLNTALFEAAGVDIPSPDWTWEEFREVAKQLTKVENGQPVQWGYYFPKYADGFNEWLRQNNGGLVTEDFAATAINTPESIEAIKFLRDMILEDKSIPTDAQAQQFGAAFSAPFIAGKVAMTIGSLSMSVSLNKENVDFRLLPLPSNKQAVNAAFVNAWAIPSGAKNPDLSWRVLEYFSGIEGQQIALNTGMGLPASKGVDTSAFVAQHPDYHYFLEAFDTAEPFPTPLYGADYTKLLVSGLELMWTGELEVEEAVAEVATTGDLILAGEQ